MPQMIRSSSIKLPRFLLGLWLRRPVTLKAIAC